MLHVVTVHFRSTRWIEPQLRFLHRFCPSETCLWASLDELGETDSVDRSRFDHVTELSGSHAEKLNTLADMVIADARPDDLLLFLDGDAFPLQPVGPRLLGGRSLAAVRRDENLGDRQPHPCFCLTTVGFWRDLGGDWRRGETWVNSIGAQVTDVGGNLRGQLERAGIDWYAFTRLNTRDLHPLWFAVYGDGDLGPIAYHHGSGFRPPFSRLDSRVGGIEPVSSWRWPMRVPIWVRLERRRIKWVTDRRRARWMEREGARQRELGDEVLAAAERDDEFWHRFYDPMHERN